MSKYVVESRDKPSGLVTDRTVFDHGDVDSNQSCAYDFAKAMAEDDYHVTLSLEIIVIDGKMP